MGEEKTFRDRLNGLYARQCASIAFEGFTEQKGRARQHKAYPWNMFELQRYDKYIMNNMYNGEQHIPHGVYVFIITKNEINKIICGVPKGNYSPPHFQKVDGHTSLNYSNGPVQYAGLIFFEKGELKEWSNGSGHYLPTIEAVPRLTPYCQHMLPYQFFKPYRPSVMPRLTSTLW